MMIVQAETADGISANEAAEAVAESVMRRPLLIY
jgi:hypothetical protein